LTRMQGGAPVGSATSQVHYSVDANGAMTSDGLRTFEYDPSRRLSKVKIFRDGEAAAVEYLHNALGQRVFKSQPQAEQTLPSEEDLGPGFVNWLRKSFGWLFTQGNGAKAALGLAFAYDEDANLLGEYDNGSAQGLGSTEYLWLPIEQGQAIPIGIYKNGKFYQVHSDHLGTPRLITNDTNTAVWQWPYSAFGNNKTTGVLQATVNGAQVTLKGTKPPVDVNLRFPGQYFDEESNLSYNGFRSYRPFDGGYTQMDPIGLGGGLNRRVYVGGNPLSYADPLGLAALEIPLPSIPLPNWVTVPGSRLLGGLGLILSLSGDTPKPGTEGTDECPPGPGGKDPCDGYRRELRNHEEKLRQYISDPNSMDNKGFLAAAAAKGDQGLYDKIYTTRILSLIHQIEIFRRDLADCERKNGKR
jgi:RHS repeat-associated protein